MGAADVARGVLLVAAGPRIWAGVAPGPPGRADEVAMNVLGARELAQGVVQLARPTALRRVFIGVDLAHAGSMALLAALDARRRRPALLSAGLALTSAVVSWRAR